MEELEHRRVGRVAEPVVERDTEPLPHVLGEEAVADQPRRFDHEILPLAQLGRGHFVVNTGERQRAEGDVSRLVSHHVAGYLLDQRFGGELVDEPEGGERDALDDDLHAEVGDVPPRIGHDQLEELAEVGVDGIGEFELLVEVAGVGLDVAGFVGHLGRTVELRFDRRDLLDGRGFFFFFLFFFLLFIIF